MIWAYLLLAVIPQDFVARDSVERLELNHFYDDNGQLVFTQLIGWERNKRCRFWKMDKTQSLIPLPDRQHGGYCVTWIDGDLVRQVRAVSCGESWTQWDVELADREHLPQDQRRPLRSLCTPSK